jgi:quinol monooxygenase YgiN
MDGGTRQGTFGLIGQLTAISGKRDELVACLRAGSRGIAGKLSYQIALDRDDPNSLWITEVWADEAAYRACLDLPQVREAAARFGALVASAGPRIETVPLADE